MESCDVYCVYVCEMETFLYAEPTHGIAKLKGSYERLIFNSDCRSGVHFTKDIVILLKLDG